MIPNRNGYISLENAKMLLKAGAEFRRLAFGSLRINYIYSNEGVFKVNETVFKAIQPTLKSNPNPKYYKNI